MLYLEMLADLERARTAGEWARAIRVCENMAASLVGSQQSSAVQPLLWAAQIQDAESFDRLLQFEKVRYRHTVPALIEQAQASGRADIVENLREEAHALDAIRQRTGASYQRLQGVPVDDPNVTRGVLPVLGDYLTTERRSATRGTIYIVFLRAPQSSEHFEKLLSLLPYEGPSGIETNLLIEGRCKAL